MTTTTTDIDRTDSTDIDPTDHLGTTADRNPIAPDPESAVFRPSRAGVEP